MALDRKALLAKAKQHRIDGVEKIKQIEFPLPSEANSAQWSPFAIAAKAEWLMVDAGVNDTIRAEFKADAVAGAEFRHLLTTVQKWFTVTVRKDEYVPLDSDIADYYDSIVAAAEPAQEEVSTPEEIEEAILDLEASEAKTQREAEIARKVTDLMREQMGLGDDEYVVIKVHKIKH